MRIYIAASFPRRFELRSVREQIQALGHEVRATWLDSPTVQDGEVWPENMVEEASRDLAEVTWSELVIVDTILRSSTGGSDVEMGFALGRNRTLWVVGPIRNGYHALAYSRFESWSECLHALKTIWLERKGTND